jgi:hypothetical protein
MYQQQWSWLLVKLCTANRGAIAFGWMVCSLRMLI